MAKKDMKGLTEGRVADIAEYLFEHVGSFIQKKKYKINSYLFIYLSKLPRKYVCRLFETRKEILRRYYTMPLRLSMSRFVSSRVLRSYYRNLSHTKIMNLRKKVSRAPLHGPNGMMRFAHLAQRQHAQTPGAANIRHIPTASQSAATNKKEGAERAKSFVMCLERRLDVSLLRLLHFKSLYTTKRASFGGPTARKRKAKPNIYRRGTYRIK
jgi:hypothetical protein